MKKVLNSLVWVLVGGFFLYLTLKGKPLDEMFKSIGSANPFWVAMNGLAIIFVFILRGYRWRILIQNTGENPKFIFVLYSLLMGFFVNAFTPRLGEVARCTTLKQANNVPVAKSLGTMVTERIWDVLVLGLGLAVIFILEFKRLEVVWDQLIDAITLLINENLVLFIALAVGLVALVIILYAVLKRRKTFEKGKAFILEFWQALRLSFRIKQYPRFLLTTLGIWVILTFMNLFSLLALKETSGYSLYFAFMVVFIGGIGWMIPSPSGIGTTHFVILHLFLAFGLPESSGVAFGVLSNGLTFGYTILIGGISLLLYQFLTKRNNKRRSAI